jgi:hypothetical protein
MSRIAIALGVLSSALLIAMAPAQAATNLRTVARFAPAKGLISDAALLPNGHIVLAYPEGSYLADYSPDGKLTRHVIREGGLKDPFTPTMVVAGNDDGLFVFDEAEHHVFRVADDGNFSKGIDLALEGAGPRARPAGGGAQGPPPSSPVAASRIGSLSLAPDGSLWALLPDRQQFAHFDAKGKQLGLLDLPALLGGAGIYARGQVTRDGTLYVLDIAQGAIYARPPVQAGAAAAPKFRRIRVTDDTRGFEAIPSLQDFAVLGDGTLLAATTDAQRPLMLLSPGANGRVSKPVSLQLGGAKQLSVRASKGSFIVWASDSPVVFVLSP